jgi:hypothetical protein
MAGNDDIPLSDEPEDVDWSQGVKKVERGVAKEATVREVLDSAYSAVADDIIRHIENCQRYNKPEAARVKQDMRAENGMRLMVVVYFVPPGNPETDLDMLETLDEEGSGH